MSTLVSFVYCLLNGSNVTKVAVLGVSFISLDRALEVFRVANACKYLPSSTKEMSTAEVSKKW